MTPVIATVVSIIALLIEVLALIVAAVWVVGKMETTTAVLGEKIDNLGGAVKHLGMDVRRITEKTDGHGEEIAVLTSKVAAIEGK